MKNSFIFCIVFFFLIACGKNSPVILTSPQNITTYDVSRVGVNEAQSGGHVLDDGGSSITSKGMVWSTSPNPTIALVTKTVQTGGIGQFTSELNNLTAATTYYVRAYASNSVGTAYGEEKSFTTLTAALPGNVYVAVQNQGGINRALLWKDASTSFLSDGSRQAFAKSIYVNETGTYVAGNEHNSSGVYVAKYWKNGQAVDLSNGQKHAFADGIFIAGNNVYTAGSEETAQQRRAKYWINNTEYNLTDGLKYAVGNAIFYASDKVYVAGNINDPMEIARYWVNGIDVGLPMTPNCIRSVAKSIWVDGGDVFVAGYQQFNAANGGKYVATVWKNTTPTLLTPPTSIGYATGVTVKNGNVYVAGYENINGINVAKYWKNGAPFSLSDGIIAAQTSSIFVTDNNDVYVAGYSGNGSFEALYWKNGQAVSNNNGTYAWGIFVY